MDLFSNKNTERLTASWKRKIAPHVPKGMVVEGVVSGGKGISHRAFFLMLGAIIGLTLLLGLWLKLTGGSVGLVVLGMLIFPIVVIALVAELGIYRSIFIFWDTRQVVIIEGGAFDRLIRRQTYPLPLPCGISWADSGTVVIEGWEIHLDYPSVCREMLIQALGGREHAGRIESGAESLPVAPEGHDGAVSRNGRSKALIAANICIILGFIGWIGAFLCSVEAVGKCPVLADLPLPVGPVEVVADHDDHLYLISKFYRRIQKYGQDGGFIHGWHLSTPKGDHRFAVDDRNRLQVVVDRDRGLHYYLDETRGLVRFDPGDSDAGVVTTLDPQATTYVYQWWHVLPKVVRIDTAGHQTTLFRTSFLLWLFTAPVPAFLLALFGILAAIHITRRNTAR